MDSQVSDIMNHQPITLSHTAYLSEARQLMANHNIRHLPVVNQQRQLVGLLSQRDLLAASDSHQIGQQPNSEGHEHKPIDSFMSTELFAVSPDMPIKRAAETLSRHHIGCLPVVRDEQLIGIVTGSDFINVAINLLQLLDDESILD